MTSIEDKLTDLEHQPNKDLMSRKWRVSLEWIAGGFAACTLIVTYFFYWKSFAGAAWPAFLMTMRVAVGVLLLIPALSVVIGSIISFIPIKGYSYRQRLRVIGLITAVILQFLAFFLFTISAIMPLGVRQE